MFAALIAKTNVDLIALDKGEVSARSIVDELITKMEEYANFGFDYIEEQLENDPNHFFKESAFLRVFTSFLTNEDDTDESNDEPDSLDDEPDSLDEDEPDSLGDSNNEDGQKTEDIIDEEAMRAEAEKPWNQDDIDRLALFFEHGMEPARISDRLGKSLYAVQFQLSQLGLMRMPLNVTVKNTDQGGTVINKSGQVIYTDEAPLKVFNDKIYRFNMKSMCMTVKDVKRVDGEWVKGGKMLVAYSDSELYPKLSHSNFIDDIEDFVEGDKREANKIKVKGIWYDYYGDKLGSKG